jgi:hypothetical protein
MTTTIFLVPIKGDSFEIAFETQESLTFTYSLLNFENEILFSEVNSLDVFENETFMISPESGIPSGELINQFNFNDGPSKTIITIKG